MNNLEKSHIPPQDGHSRSIEREHLLSPTYFSFPNALSSIRFPKAIQSCFISLSLTGPIYLSQNLDRLKQSLRLTHLHTSRSTVTMSTIRQRAPSPSAGQMEKAQLIHEAEEKELAEGQKWVHHIPGSSYG